MCYDVSFSKDIVPLCVLKSYQSDPSNETFFSKEIQINNFEQTPISHKQKMNKFQYHIKKSL